MHSLYICQGLYKELLKKDFNGTVHSVFSNSFNVLDENQTLITFLNSKKPMSPNSIKIDTEIYFQLTGIRPGLNVHFTHEFAEINDLRIRINYKDANIWIKKPDLSFKKDNKENVYIKLNKLGEYLLFNGNKNGIYYLITTLEHSVEGIELFFSDDTTIKSHENFIKDRFISFIDSYIDEDIKSLPYKSREIVGYGIGLTPSMDDFLAGIMVSRIYLSYYLGQSIEDAYKINKAIIREIENKTTIISQEMLKFSSIGETNDNVRNFMVSFLGRFSMNTFVKDLEKVISIGETSGTDMLLGIYIGSCIMLTKN